MKRIPRHVGIIPDGNRRWAMGAGLRKQDGYVRGIEPGLRLYDACRRRGIEELSIYGFTQDNVRRPAPQVKAFREACLELAERLVRAGAPVTTVGDERSPLFIETRPEPQARGPKANLLVNYGWMWDLDGLKGGEHRSAAIPPLDLIIRWGGGRRLSGFLPVQSVYADVYVVDALWPDYEDKHLDDALAWYARQDRTKGG